jgi:trehalose 6-phosphate synthase
VPHRAHAPTFRGEDWEQYRAVNAKFVSTVLEEVDSDDPIVLVQDYHFALAPALIRRVLPRAKVLMFWHIPWPNAEQFGICPFSDEILEGMLGASILGFHTQFHCNNFLDAVDRSLEARIDRERDAVVHHGHETLVHPYPISVEWPMRQLAGVPDAKTCRAEVLQELGLPSSTLLGVGVDRMDYTKGIQERLLAVERLFERNPEYLGRFTFVQLAAPSRTEIERYRLLNEEVEALAQRIDRALPASGLASDRPPARAPRAAHGVPLPARRRPVLRQQPPRRHEPGREGVRRRARGRARRARALAVHGRGARADRGPDREPLQPGRGAAALATALEMPADEQQMRLRAMRSYLAEFNVYGWAGRMLIDAARLQRRERLSHSLNGGAAASAVAG